MRLHCYSCGKSVSNEVPGDTVVRAILVCPECIEELDLEIVALGRQPAFEKVCPKCGTNNRFFFGLSRCGWPCGQCGHKIPIEGTES